MRAPADLRPLAAALCAGIALGACGDGLYDATGVPVLDGSGLGCDAGLVVCGAVCTPEDASHCGSACADCTSGAAGLPAGAQPACLREGATATCGYECTDGLLKCATGCCGTAALAAGDAHTCALLASGEVACWGANGSGQVGDGTTAPRLAPRRVALGAAAVALAAGVSHSCAVLEGGAVRCWGANEAGQVTGSAGLAVLAPAAVAGISGATAIAAGRAHTCAALAGGAVRCWGSNGLGQLGPGGQPIAAGEGTAALVAGRDHACALVQGGAVRCWGSNTLGQLGGTAVDGMATPIPAGSGMLHLAAGGDHTCAGKLSSTLELDDALRCWGDSVGDVWGLLSPQPTPAIPLRRAGRAAIRHDVTRLAVGGHHVCVRGDVTALECLGANDAGQLGGPIVGLGAQPPEPEAVVVALTAPPDAPLAAGASHTCAAKDAGKLRCFGANGAGQLGDGTSITPGVGVLATPLGR